MEAIYQLKQSSPSYTEETKLNLLAELKIRVEDPLFAQLKIGDPLVSPHTLDLLIACYAHIEAPNDAMRCFGEMQRFIDVWRKEGAYGFDSEVQDVVLGSASVTGMMTAFGRLGDAEGMERLCLDSVYQQASLSSHYRKAAATFNAKKSTPLRKEKAETDDDVDQADLENEAVPAKVENVTPTTVLDLEPFEKGYEAFVEGWLQGGHNEGALVDLLQRLRAEEKKRAGGLQMGSLPSSEG
ncbi:hypothetical protein HDU67_003527 [Dinochytrium kinnereticum]|nr:hypothetical protein HDU67_003527 [Dinochytrium kinnereticum]